MRIKQLIGRSLLICLLSLGACQQPEASQQQKKSDTESRKESRLTLNNATLEQSNVKGQTLWKIQVQEAAYSPDQKKAQLKNIKGNLFQDGKIVLKVKASEGEMDRDGEKVFLRRNIIATDPRNGAILRSEEVEWRPREDVLIVSQNLRGTHAKLDVSAKEGKYYTRQQKLELSGNIIATAKDPRLQLKTEHLVWKIDQQKVIGDRLLKLVRYEKDIITDQILANRVEVRLDKKEVLIQENIEFKSIEPPVQVAGTSLLWKYQNRLVESDSPIKLIHYVEGITLIGNRGEADLAKKEANLSAGVEGSSIRNEAKLYANNLHWDMTTQILQATGNVIYQQVNPQFKLTGEKATGTLQNHQIVVQGNQSDRVVTEIVPESN